MRRMMGWNTGWAVQGAAWGMTAWLLLGAARLVAAGEAWAGANLEADAALQALVARTAGETVNAFASKGLKADDLAITLVDLREPGRPRLGSHRGDVAIYPASVIKLFYLVAAHRWLEDGRLEESAELRRAMRDMIVESYNEATHYVLDVLTDTTSGPELPGPELAAWQEKRNAVNRYFTSLGYTNINANKKPWCEGPYGREMQAIRAFEPRRNWLTTEATARLLTEIATGRAVTPERSEEMMALLRRDPQARTPDPDDQAKFTGPGLPPGAKLWSKAGWTSETRHDAACIEVPGGRRLVLVVFTERQAKEREIIPFVARRIIESLAAR